MKPYLEVKVVKVKKEEKSCNAEFICPICNKVLHHKDKPEKKGNWVNGENLDKIKFPVPCTHKDKSNGYSGYGMLMRGINQHMDSIYILADIGKQRDELTTVSQSESLRDLIETWDIHIIKAKIILFEEE